MDECLYHRGRQTLAIRMSSMGGEEHLCAADAWAAGWFQHGWPEPYPRHVPGDPRYHDEMISRGVLQSGLRHFSGPPAPGQILHCECACGHDGTGRFAEMDPDQGILRCPQCVAANHPPRVRAGLGHE